MWWFLEGILGGVYMKSSGETYTGGILKKSYRERVAGMVVRRRTCMRLFGEEMGPVEYGVMYIIFRIIYFLFPSSQYPPLLPPPLSLS